jgi:fructose-1,6-bisphosphatase/inositol monophosphatase family enzyme
MSMIGAIRPLFRVFISYSWDSDEHRAWVRKLAAVLDSEDDIETVLDQTELWAGKDLLKFMEKGLTETDRVILILTPNYAKKASDRKGGVGYENLIITSQIFKQYPEDRFIPVLRGDPKTSIPLYLASRVYVDLTDDSEFLAGAKEIVRSIRRLPAKKPRKTRTSEERQVTADAPRSLGRGRLTERIADSYHWEWLHEAAIRAVTAGGMAAMSLYRRSSDWSRGLPGNPTESKNPSTQADLEATAAILQTIDPYLARIARLCGCGLKYLGEETGRIHSLHEKLAQQVMERIQPPEQFFTEEENELRVILDGIDGTGSFIRGIPLFCSGLAILVGVQPRVAALYDPIHHRVYSGVLSGSFKDPAAVAEAWSWDVASGNRVDLVNRRSQARPPAPREQAIGIHFTRSHPEKLRTLVRSESLEHESTLERLSRKVGAIYALNSGLLAMVEVARGALGAFVNITTNLWDVAAGEVLVRACGGKVTELDDKSVSYSVARPVSVLAAGEPLHSTLIELFGQRE